MYLMAGYVSIDNRGETELGGWEGGCKSSWVTTNNVGPTSKWGGGGGGGGGSI